MEDLLNETGVNFVFIGIILGVIVSVIIFRVLKMLGNFWRNLFRKDGDKFEKECMEILRKNGWKAEGMGKSGDNGVDIFAEKKSWKVAIQCKNLKGKVNNSAVQEIYAGKDYYRLNPKFNGKFNSQCGIVVYKNKEKKFTAPAKDLADVLGIKFLHYKELEKLEKNL